MNTLGLRSDSIIADYLKRRVNDLPVDLKHKEGRKRYETVKAFAYKNYIDIKHIDFYNQQVSHYNSENASDRRYLPCDITIREMYNEFVTNFFKISYETCRKIFKIIGLASPTQDNCGMCSTYKKHVHQTDMLSTSMSTDFEKLEVEREWMTTRIKQYVTFVLNTIFIKLEQIM